MQEDICYASMIDLAAKIRSKVVSPVEVVTAHLERIEALNPTLNAIVMVAEDAREQAEAAEAAVMRGDELGALHGVPYTLKDCIETAGFPCTQGSKLLQNAVASQDATVASRLQKAGGILLGKTNMPEFALWWETDNALFGRTCNPWDLSRTTGGSSGGEAAAIAAGLSALGLGTDLGGSIREPAAFCGIVGLKPTLGRVPYTGIQPQALLRAIHVGPMARTVADIAAALSVLAGPDDRDVYCPPVPVPDYTALAGPPPALKVGWSATAGIPVEAEVRATVVAAAEALVNCGFTVEEAELPELRELDAGEISAILYRAEAGHHLTPLIAGREADLTDLLRSRYVDSPTPSFEAYLEAGVKWERLKQAVQAYFTRYDVFLCPTVPMCAFPHGQTTFNIKGQSVGGRHAMRGTVLWDLTGSPAISVPFGWNAADLPLAVQVVGRHFDERTVLQVAHALENCQPERRHPV